MASKKSLTALLLAALCRPASAAVLQLPSTPAPALSFSYSPISLSPLAPALPAAAVALPLSLTPVLAPAPAPALAASAVARLSAAAVPDRPAGREAARFAALFDGAEAADPLIGPLAPSAPIVADRAGEALALARSTKIGRRVLARADKLLSKGRPIPMGPGGARNDNGAYDYMRRRLILNRATLSGDPRELAATLVHELRHILQHAEGVPAEALEMEIEAHFDSLEVLRELGVEPADFAAAFAEKAAQGREALYRWMEGQMPGKLVLRGASLDDLQEALETEIEEQDEKSTRISRGRAAAAQRDLILVRSAAGRRAMRALVARVDARIAAFK